MSRRRGVFRAAAPAGLLCAVLAGVLLAVPATRSPALLRTADEVSTAAGADAMTVDTALGMAETTGQAVNVPSFTTETDTLDARPDGKLALTQSLVPVRRMVDGGWKALDATLRQNPDGSWSPAVTAGGLRVSNGGSGPVVTMYAAGSSLALSLSSVGSSAALSLPRPAVTGSTARYSEIFPGVDLAVIGDEFGSFSEVFVIKDAAAAANPALRSLRWSTATVNLRLSADAAGNLEGRNASGTVLVTAPAPTMWDSRSDPGQETTTDPSGVVVDASTGDPVVSSTASAGVDAQVSPVGVTLDGAGITLTPDAAMLASPDTAFPVYIDPGFTAPKRAGASASTAWTYVSSQYDTTSYWKSKDLRVGYEGHETPYFKARSFIRLSVPTKLLAGTVVIFSSSLQLNETWSASCDKRVVNLYHTGEISSATTWDKQPAKKELVDSVSAAKGYSSACKAGNIPFDVTALITSVKASATVTVGLYSSDESDKWGWKKFSPKVDTSGDYGSLTTLFDHPPVTPIRSTMATSPTTVCAGMTIVGDAAVTLAVTPSDADHQKLGVGFRLFTGTTATTASIVWSTDDGQSADSYVTSAYSATTGKYAQARKVVPKATLENVADKQPVSLSWQTQVWDGIQESGWSSVCYFTFDPTRPGQPDVVDADAGYTVGRPGRFTVTGDGASYQYLLNGRSAGPPALADANGAATITVPAVTAVHNVLSVTAVSAGGNVSLEHMPHDFDADVPEVAVDGDLTTDRVADLAVVGAASGKPSPGLWTASGTGAAGALVTTARNVGTFGTGRSTTGAAADFIGSQSVIGRFRAANVQDVLAYFPTATANADGSTTAAGTGVVLAGNADGTILPQQPEDVDWFTADDLSNADVGLGAPMWVANGGDVSGDGRAVPDLFGIATSDVGPVLEVVPSGESDAGDYAGGRIVYAAANSTTLLGPPVAGTLWSAWRITAAQSATGPVVFLWRPGVAGVWRWAGLHYSDNGDGTAALTVDSAVQVSALAPTAASTVQAVDLTGDTVPDLRVVTGGVATAYVSNAAGSALTAQPSQTLSW